MELEKFHTFGIIQIFSLHSSNYGNKNSYIVQDAPKEKDIRFLAVSIFDETLDGD